MGNVGPEIEAGASDALTFWLLLSSQPVAHLYLQAVAATGTACINNTRKHQVGKKSKAPRKHRDYIIGKHNNIYAQHQ